MQAELSTPRLKLTRPIADDVPFVLAMHRDPRTTEHNPSERRETLAAAQALYEQWDLHWQQHGFGYWIVRKSDDGTAIGCCGLKAMRLHNRPVLNLFYRFSADQWGRGYATEAAGRVVQWVKAVRPHDTVIARVRPDNLASQRVATNIGLARTGAADGDDGLDWIYSF